MGGFLHSSHTTSVLFHPLMALPPHSPNSLTRTVQPAIQHSHTSQQLQYGMSLVGTVEVFCYSGEYCPLTEGAMFA